MNVPPAIPFPATPNGKSSVETSSISTQVADQTARRLDERDLMLKYSYVASELLTSDNILISDAVVSDDAVMAIIFSFIEKSSPGNLNTIVAIHFAKMIISLLKMRNAQTIEKMSKRETCIVSDILKHMDSSPIAELVVRILDSPDLETMCASSTNKRPTDAALDLLAEADLLGGLGECFVCASSEELRNEVDALTESDKIAPNDNSQEYPNDWEESSVRERRRREETMANVTITILGLTERILQLPELGCSIPAKLSPYSSPGVIMRLLDAGLFASCNGKTEIVGHEGEVGYSEEKVQAFSSGSNSALLHSLGLAADLMTTEANVFRDEEADNDKVVADMPPELRNKQAGDLIVETKALENELALRFSRLAEMFGSSMDDEAGYSKPLGSLRLQLAEFFVACMKKSAQSTVDQITSLGIPKKLLELFGKYQWSSMLHGVVTKSIVCSLNGDETSSPARVAWFQAGLIPWLIETWSRNATGEESAIRSRAGYMGHLIRIGTALKGYIEESEENSYADMPDKNEVKTFAVFSEEVLVPAHFREATPLCEDRLGHDGDDDVEAEEATDILDMADVQIVDSLIPESSNKKPMQLGYAAVKPDDDLDEEGEIKPVEVDDLGHFGTDGDELIRSVDHDIPIALRDQPLRASEHTKPPVPPKSHVEKSSISDTLQYESLGGLKFSPQDIPLGDELTTVIDSVDSSSEDEGSYEAFVDDRKEKEVSKVFPGDMTSHKLDQTEPAAFLLEGAVTEIEEPGPLPSDHLTQSLASNAVVSITDDGNSSDDYEVWEDPAGASMTNPERPMRSKEDELKEAEPRKVA